VRTWITTRTLRRAVAVVALATATGSIALAAPVGRVTAQVGLEDDGITTQAVESVSTASIGDRVWWDLDDDGVQDPGEPGLPGVVLTATPVAMDGLPIVGDLLVRTVTTDSFGAYLFADMMAGSYLVQVEGTDLPPGFTPVYDLDGGIFAPDHRWVGTVADGEARRDVDFAYGGSGRIGDAVWFDQNGDGIRDTNEPGLAGVAVTVTWNGIDGVEGGVDDHEFTTSTDAEGRYQVVDLPAGLHTVRVEPTSLPSGFTMQTGDPDTVLDSSSMVTLLPGATDAQQGFGYAGAGSIGNAVWFDHDGDGVRETGDEGISGAMVTVTWSGPDGLTGGGDDASFTQSTTASGGWVFHGLPGGTYGVAVDGLPSDFVNTADEDGDRDGRHQVVLLDGQDHLTADFGYRGPTATAAAVGERVWWDLDVDGQQDSGEPGLPGVRVTVTHAGADGVFGNLDDVVFVRTTDRDGRYPVTATAAGDHRVAVTGGVPAGMTATHDDASSPDGFGFGGTASIGDLVYLDLDRDGAAGDGDRGIPGAGVVLTWAGSDQAFATADDVDLQTHTDATGNYRFDALPAGTFRVAVTPIELPGGLMPFVGSEMSAAGADGAADHTSVLSLTPGQADLAQDFGYSGTGAIGDGVWLDLDGNAQPTAGEPGVPAVGMTLTWAGFDDDFGSADDVVRTTSTDAAGTYRFEQLPGGSYRLAVATGDLPRGVRSSGDPDGGSDNGSSLILAAGVARTEQDFGFRGDASAGDRAWLDVDADGRQDAGEPGYAGLPLAVLMAGADAIFATADDIAVSVTTANDGSYLLTGMPSGRVRISYASTALADGQAPGSDRDGGDATSSAMRVDIDDRLTDIDFGVRGTSALHGVMWNDIDSDGARRPGESGMAGVTIIATWTGPSGPVSMTTVTDASGAWSFGQVPSGAYTVTVDQTTVPAGLVASTPSIVSSVVLAGAEVTVQHGSTMAASVGDLIWMDLDRSGTFDAGDRGIGDITVELVDAQGHSVATTTTDASGRYLFAAVVPGRYRVVIADRSLAGHPQFADPDGTMDAQAWVTLGPGDVTMAQDFGFGSLQELPASDSNPLRSLGLGVLLVGACSLVPVAASRRRG
jgi:hypothetical protein